MQKTAPGLLALTLAGFAAVGPDPAEARTAFEAGSASGLEAALPAQSLTPAAADTKAAHAAFGGVWAGWLCSGKSVDIKFAVREVTNDGATVVYASASDSFGRYNHTFEARFDGGKLRGRFPDGGAMVFDLRSPDRMTIDYAISHGCSGEAKRQQSLPTR